ncbi:MAG: hypothetical protein NTY35_08955 [Planctomycetota bacterium]|nr:hypothetical protein [Planctomycetota bacterium]
MRTCIPILLLALPACQAPQAPPQSASSSPPADSRSEAAAYASSRAAPGLVLGGLLPPATKPLMLRQTPTTPATLLDLVHQLQDSTGVAFVLEESTRASLSRTPSGFQGELEVPADQAWRVAETILVRNEYVLLPTLGRAPQIVTIVSLAQPNGGELKSRAVEVQASQLEDCVNHPAVLVMTVVDVHPLDARMVSTTLRQLMPDPTTQSILPIGSGNQLLIVGFGPEVAKFAGMLTESARVERERTPDVQTDPKAATPR